MNVGNYGQIDWNKSISSGRLSFTTNQYLLSSLYVCLMICAPLIMLSVCMGRSILNPLVLLLLAWSVFDCYLKFQETKLVHLSTQLDKEELETKLLSYIESDVSWSLVKKSDNIIIANTEYGFVSFNQITVILFEDDKIFVAVLGNNLLLKRGTFLSKKEIVKDLEREIGAYS